MYGWITARRITVGFKEVYEGRFAGYVEYVYDSPKTVREFVRKFDHGGVVAPMKFKLGKYVTERHYYGRPVPTP